MVMESREDEYFDYANYLSLDDESFLPVFSQSPGVTNGYRFREEPPLDLSYLKIPDTTINSGSCTSDESSCLSSQAGSPDELSECVFKYINQILVDENLESKHSMFHDPLALQVTERSFYEALGENYTPESNVENPEDNFFSSGLSEHSTNSYPSCCNSTDSYCPSGDFFEVKSSVEPKPSLEYPSLSSFDSTSTTGSVKNDQFGTSNSMINTHIAENIFTDSESILQFNRGMEEASKFLPPSKPLILDLGHYNLPSNTRDTFSEVFVKEEFVDIDNSSNRYRGRKHYQIEDNGYEEERSKKLPAVHSEEDVLSELFDRVVLCNDPGGPLSMTSYEEPVKQVPRKLQQNGQTYRYSSGWISHSWGGSSGKPMDVRTLLVNCAHSVAANDHMTANEQLRQIRQHASPLGDPPQRLAYIFANALEARLAGTGSQLYAAKSAMTISAADKLKACQVYLAACPFKKVAISFMNKVIHEAASTATTLHIIDFGIEYGFPWPVIIKKLSQRPGGPPKLRITGIELPRPGFRPAEGVEETGRSLAKYCAKFNVPFEYNAIATQNWEKIKLEELKLRRNECLVVNTLIRFKNLLDESVVVDSPRDGVLKLIREMKPDIFLQTVVNGSYSSPVFVTRFKEALFHFSNMFDMFDAVVDRDDEHRLNFEKEFCGREVINVIACEGAERVERPETYTQWQARLKRAGLKIKPLNRDLVSELRAKVKAGYHKDFVFDDDGKWMLQGWKGRILRATSCWVPA
uniref:scarecrow-like protein 14 n=1 Tax=Erigeron canadensis TaxID=72917 RepID=UPI001CB8B3E4|nr:scarecrow-like protein 14 [Erigeron canadensis]